LIDIFLIIRFYKKYRGIKLLKKMYIHLTGFAKPVYLYFIYIIGIKAIIVP